MWRRNVLVAAAVALGLGLVTLVTAQTGRDFGTQKPMTLTAMDYIEIQQLVARYPFELNSGADNGYAMADLFTPDAIFCGRLVCSLRGVTPSRHSRAADGAAVPHSARRTSPRTTSSSRLPRERSGSSTWWC